MEVLIGSYFRDEEESCADWQMMNIDVVAVSVWDHHFTWASCSTVTDTFSSTRKFTHPSYSLQTFGYGTQRLRTSACLLHSARQTGQSQAACKTTRLFYRGREVSQYKFVFHPVATSSSLWQVHFQYRHWLLLWKSLFSPCLFVSYYLNYNSFLSRFWAVAEPLITAEK